MKNETVTEIKTFFKGEVKDDTKTLDRLSRDTSLFKVKPSLSVAPRDTEDVSRLVSYIADKNKAGERLTITGRSAGTDMTGGPLTEGIVMEFTPHMNKIMELTDDHAVVEPGLYYRDLEKATLARNRLMPSYTASKELCAVGGMVSNNSGGEKTLTYGKTENYVQKLQVVLSDGSIMECKKLNRNELEQKMSLSNLEGHIYREIYKLCSENYDQLQQAKPTVTKNSSGYYLWNVYDREADTFDLTKLIVGSQGTLAMVTEIDFSLIIPHQHSRLVVVFLNEINPLATVIKKLLSHNPESLESYDDHTFKFAVKLFPMIMKRMKGSAIRLGLRFWPEFKAVITGGLPRLILLAEFTGDTYEEATKKAEEALKEIQEAGHNARLTKDADEAEKYWIMRRESFNLLRQKMKNVRTAPFIEDFAVHPNDLPKFLPELYAILDQYELTYTTAGHMGDANFHIIPLMDMSKPESQKVIHELTEKVHNLIFAYKGTFSAEHNDGLIRSRHLPRMFGDDIYELFRKTKDIFDPQNIFNPGKKVYTDTDFADRHMVKNNL